MTTVSPVIQISGREIRQGARPFLIAEVAQAHDGSLGFAHAFIDIAAEAGIIEKSGAWYSYGSQRIGQGRENAKLYLKDNPALMTEVEEKVKGILGIKAADTQADSEVAVDD